MQIIRIKSWRLALICIATALLFATAASAAGKPAAQTTAAVVAATAAAPLSDRQCDISITPHIGPGCPGNATQAVGPANYDAARLDNGNAALPIDAWASCRYVDNKSTDKSIFVPFRSSAEWQSFIHFAPPFISLMTCARPGTVAVPINYPTYPTGAPNPWYNADLSCEASTEQNVSIPNYGRTNASTYTAQLTFTQQCTVKGICDLVHPPNCGADQRWTLSAIATFTAGQDNDNGSKLPSGGWKLTNVVYAGEKPEPNMPVADGVCGVTTGRLCISGTVSSPASTPNGAIWTCNGTSGGKTASCSAASGNNAVCGSEAGTCDAGTADTASIKDGGKNTIWKCGGLHGGHDIYCIAPDKDITATGGDGDNEATDDNEAKTPEITPPPASASNLHTKTCGTSVGPGKPTCSDGKFCVPWTNSCSGATGTTCYSDASCQ